MKRLRAAATAAAEKEGRENKSNVSWNAIEVAWKRELNSKLNMMQAG